MSREFRDDGAEDIEVVIHRALDMAEKRQHRAALVGFGMGAIWAGRQDLLPVERERLLRVARVFADRFMTQQALEMQLEIPIGDGLLEGLDEPEGEGT